MQIPAHILSPCAFPLNKCPKALAFSGMTTWTKSLSSAVRLRGNTHNSRKKDRGAVALAIEEGTLGSDEKRQRKVVEHICLLKAKEELSEEQENDMLDYLYTTQYQMSGIVAISLGRISDRNPEHYTHAVFMRFQQKEDLAKFYENPFYMKVLEEHVMPYCRNGLFNFDYESEVEDDILPIFRKGEEYNYGVELVLLVAFDKSSLGGHAEDAMTSLATLRLQFPSLIVQATTGPTINMGTMEYTHGVVIRFRSYEAFKMFMSSSEYISVWKSKFEPITKKSLSVHFLVDPIAKELM